MYNRYIPQSDGSYRRNPVQEQRSSQPQRQNHAPPQQTARREPDPPRQIQPQIQPQISPISFLKGLLPKDFDTADLLVVILLLLMAGDSGENQNTAILTLALYLFL